MRSEYRNRFRPRISRRQDVFVGESRVEVKDCDLAARLQRVAAR